MNKYPSASIIIVNYNGKDFVGACIDSVLNSDYPNFEIVVVDNASQDNSYKYLQKQYANNNKIRIIHSERQLYFTGGANFGAKQAKGELLFFLNSDTMVEQKCLTELIEFVNNRRNWIVQPKILKSNNKPKHKLSRSDSIIIDNVGGKYTFWGLGLGIGNGEIDSGQYDKNLEVDFANGTAFMITKKFFWQLKGFDERFKFFYEDVDLSLRAKKQDGKCWYCYRGIVYHQGSLTFKQNMPSRQIHFYFWRNRILSLLKNENIIDLLVKFPILITVTILLICEKFLSSLLKSVQKAIMCS